MMSTHPSTARATTDDDGFVVLNVPASVALARRYAVDACTAHDWPGDCDTVALLVSEVTTNALVHGDGHIRVHVAAVGSRLRVEVSDSGSGLPLRRDAADDAEGGRGLALVDALAVDWGVEGQGAGKVVWFEIA